MPRTWLRAQRGPAVACTRRRRLQREGREKRTHADRAMSAQNKKTAPTIGRGCQRKIRRRPTLPHGLPCSTIGAGELNFRVRDGIGCDIAAITTGNRRNRFKEAEVNQLLPATLTSCAGDTHCDFPVRRNCEETGKCQAGRPISIGQLHALRRFHLQPITS